MKKYIVPRLLFLFSLAFFVDKATAQTPFYLLNNSGALYTFCLEDNPRFWRSSSLLHVQTETTKINFVFSKVSQIFWDNDLPTYIATDVEDNAKFEMRGEKLYISGTDKPIYVYSVKGILHDRVEMTQQDVAVIDVSGYERGTYIVKVGTFTFKFVKQ